jgi:hypothetical protein
MNRLQRAALLTGEEKGTRKKKGNALRQESLGREEKM